MAHKHACGAASKEDEAIGKSVGGHTTKIHALCDSHGNLMDFVLTGGNVHDSKPAPGLIETLEAQNFIADKAYHSTVIRSALADKNISDIIPVKSNSLDQSNKNFDSHLYKIRHLIENFFCRIKE